eukprot:4766447-Amphidinium_carterae.1
MEVNLVKCWCVIDGATSTFVKICGALEIGDLKRAIQGITPHLSVSWMRVKTSAEAQVVGNINPDVCNNMSVQGDSGAAQYSRDHGASTGSRTRSRSTQAKEPYGLLFIGHGPVVSIGSFVIGTVIEYFDQEKGVSVSHTAVLTAAHCLYVEEVRNMWRLMNIASMVGQVQIGVRLEYISLQEPQFDVACWVREATTRPATCVSFPGAYWCSMDGLMALHDTELDLVVHENAAQMPVWLPT